MIHRASLYSFGRGLELRNCSQDAEGVAARQGLQLDWTYIEESLTPLAELRGHSAIIPAMDRIRHR